MRAAPRGKSRRRKITHPESLEDRIGAFPCPPLFLELLQLFSLLDSHLLLHELPVCLSDVVILSLILLQLPQSLEGVEGLGQFLESEQSSRGSQEGFQCGLVVLLGRLLRLLLKHL